MDHVQLSRLERLARRLSLGKACIHFLKQDWRVPVTYIPQARHHTFGASLQKGARESNQTFAGDCLCPRSAAGRKGYQFGNEFFCCDFAGSDPEAREIVS